MQLEIIVSQDTNLLVPILHDADEDDVRTANAIADVANTTYAAYKENECVGAFMMHWADESEILYIAIDKTFRGHGYGKVAIAWIIAEAQRRAVHAVIVGTANSSLDNIAFYQKCGFRMDSVRKDYFSYLQTPVYEQGILIRDMIMLRYEIGA
jgi:ribosomal protein S18 acetylase RimI-like enzyme